MSLSATDTAPLSTGTSIVLDSAEFAWNISDQGCLADLDRDFVTEWRSEIDRVATHLLSGTLVAEWGRRGWTVHLVPADRFEAADAIDEPSHTVYLDVANAAAAAIDLDALMLAADLRDAYTDWVENR